jgi:hypothetical protein
MEVPIIRVDMHGADDTPAQDERILKELRRRRLLNRHHLYRGFKRQHLDQLLKSGIDHDPRLPTFVSTKKNLEEDADNRYENALAYALDGGCLAVYREPLVPDSTLGRHVPPNIRDHLVAVLVINW